MSKSDIVSRPDLMRIVDSFYDKVKHDNLLGPVFSHVDWPRHLPVMYNFWCSMILGEQSYRGNPLQVHLHLPIERVHFAKWVELFLDTVDENFHGDRAEELKTRAQAIAHVFQHKMGLMKPDLSH